MEVCREIKRLIDSYNVSEEWCEEALKMLKEIYLLNSMTGMEKLQIRQHKMMVKVLNIMQMYQEYII